MPLRSNVRSRGRRDGPWGHRGCHRVAVRMVSEGKPSERLGCPRLMGRRSMRCSKGPLTWPC